MDRQVMNKCVALSFDGTTEADIIEMVDVLCDKRALGKYVSDLIRLAWDNPELIDRGNGKVRQGELLKQIHEAGIAHNREQFLRGLAKDVDDMKKKVDKIYEMTLKEYTLAQFGKQIGLEDKSRNLMASSFVLERQMNELNNELGRGTLDLTFESSKMQSVEKHADDVLEYILETYDGIVTELKNTMMPVQNMQSLMQNIATMQSLPVQVQGQVQGQGGQSITGNNVQIQSVPIKSDIPKVVETSKSTVTNEDDAIIDFGDTVAVNFDDADFSALENFFGDY
jgi:hypothetical protein